MYIISVFSESFFPLLYTYLFIISAPAAEGKCLGTLICYFSKEISLNILRFRLRWEDQTRMFHKVSLGTQHGYCIVKLPRDCPSYSLSCGQPGTCVSSLIALRLSNSCFTMLCFSVDVRKSSKAPEWGMKSSSSLIVK